MAFAIFYNRADLTPIAAEFTRQDLSPADRQFAQSVWQAGGSAWNTAPIAPPEHRCVTNTSTGEVLCDDDTRILVINGNHKGSPITLAQFRDFLYRQSVLPGAEYLAALADDMGGRSGAIEPWPEV